MEHTETTTILKSLADDMRLSIVRRLASEKKPVLGSAIVSDCASFLKLSQPTMSHHFNKLAQSGVLLVNKVGTEKYYQINHTLLATIGIDATKL